MATARHQKAILVTGGAGFLGSHLCEKLLANGHRVLCADNLLTGNPDNVEHLQTNPRFELIEHDVTESLHVDVDEIYNLACPASPPLYQADPIATLKTSFLGSTNVLELAGRTGAKVLQASTSEIYGEPKIHPQRENYWGNVNPNGPRACYDEGKRCAETLFLEHHRQNGTRIKIARIFNTYGPRMSPDDGRVVSNFIVQALQNLPITVYGSGGQTRSFCYVDDLIHGLIALMESAKDVTGPINLGNPQEIRVRDLATLIVQMTGSRSSIQQKPLPKDDPTRRCPDMTMAQQALNWMPRTGLGDGIENTIAYFRNRLTQQVEPPFAQSA